MWKMAILAVVALLSASTAHAQAKDGPQSPAGLRWQFYSPDSGALMANELVLDARDGRLLPRHGFAGRAIAFSPDGRQLAFAHGLDLYLKDLASGKRRTIRKQERRHPPLGGKVMGGSPPPGRGGLRYLRDPDRLLLARSNGMLEVVPTGQAKITRTPLLWQGMRTTFHVPQIGHERAWPLISPDGKRVLFPTRTAWLLVKESAPGIAQRSFPCAPFLLDASWDPLGRWFGVLSEKKLILHNTETGDFELTLTCADGVSWSGFSADDTGLLATIDSARNVKVWEVASETLVVAWRAKQETATVALSPNGRNLATGQANGLVLSWRAWPAAPKDWRKRTTSQLWQQMRTRSAGPAHAAMTEFERRGDVPFLARALARPVATQFDVPELIVKLKDPRWKVRRQAMAALRRERERVALTLEDTLVRTSSVEVRKLLQALLQPRIKLDDLEVLRRVRALRLLAGLGKKEAWDVVASVAQTSRVRRVRRLAAHLLATRR